MKVFEIKYKSKNTKARIGVLHTAHGVMETPVFMPPASKGYLKSLDTLDINNTKTQIILINAYHLFLNPGVHFIQKYGGIHSFMNWNKPIISDSGGFQVWSLNNKNNKLARIKDDGVYFISPYDGFECFINAQTSIQIQHNLGSDIVMAFDECSKDKGSKKDIKKSLDLTNKWLKQSLETHIYLNKRKNNKVLFFGIVQGGRYKDLRLQSLEFVKSLDTDGIAFGGETIGYNMKDTKKLLNYLVSFTLEYKPRYAMGLGGKPQDIVDAIILGIDMFDCVSPARIARHGELFTGVLDFNTWKIKSKVKNNIVRIANSTYRNDKKPIDEHCKCFTCQNYSRAYLRYLFMQHEPLYMRLATIHNIYFINNIIQEIKNYIKNE